MADGAHLCMPAFAILAAQSRHVTCVHRNSMRVLPLPLCAQAKGSMQMGHARVAPHRCRAELRTPCIRCTHGLVRLSPALSLMRRRTTRSCRSRGRVGVLGLRLGIGC